MEKDQINKMIDMRDGNGIYNGVKHTISEIAEEFQMLESEIEELLKKPVGRPTQYNNEILLKSREYLLLERPSDDEVIPSIEGLARYINIARSTIYEWIKQEDKKAFSDIIDQILAEQGKSLVNNGLNGKFNSTITKVILSKHGYSERQEITGKDGEKFEGVKVYLPKKEDNQDEK